jgi:hypothetical protein
MITDYVEKIMRNGIDHFSKELNKSNQEVQLLIFWDAEEEKPKYKKLVQGSSNEIVSFNQILNVRFDMMNREGICANFISKTLERFSNQLECPMTELFIVIHLEPNEDVDDVKLHLYKKQNLIQELDLEQILG